MRRKILHDQAAHHAAVARAARRWRATSCSTGVRAYLPEDYTSKEHFTPSYRPWQQRLAYVPDGDLFKGIQARQGVGGHRRDRDASPRTGILLEVAARSSTADIIVTATGFDLSVLGDIAFTIDGKPLDLHDTVTYRGMMFTGVPNLLWVFGYFRASWTLRADLIADFVCRLLHHMKTKRREAGRRRAAARGRATCRCSTGSIRRTSTPAT